MGHRVSADMMLAYSAFVSKEIHNDKEIMSGRAQHIETVVGLRNKMTEIQEKIEKELNSKRPDLTKVDRLYKILKNIQGTLKNVKTR